MTDGDAGDAGIDDLNDPFVPLAEAARVLQMKTDTLVREANAGKIRIHRMGGRFKVRRSALRAYIAASEYKPTALAASA